MRNQTGKKGDITIAASIKQSLQKVFFLILAVVILIAVSLTLFSRYAGVVNSAGIVRGGSQRVIKQVIAGSDETKAMSAVDTNLGNIKKQMRIGKFTKSRNEVEVYWNNTIKKDIEEFKKSGDYKVLLENSETLFQMTNEMVNNAQKLVDVIAIALYVILGIFVLLCFYMIRNVSAIFVKNVATPIKGLEKNLNDMAEGVLSQEFIYEKQDEIGKLYEILNHMRIGILSYIRDIDRNLTVMAEGNLVKESDMKYLGDYKHIQQNLFHIRRSFSTEFENMDEQADRVALSAKEVARISKNLEEGAVHQTDSIRTLQEKICTTLEENTKVDSYVEEARKSSEDTSYSVQLTREQMSKAVEAMKDISQASEEIRNIVNALDDITSETSLLSLNASIEAARAGEAGRGFAIVAENVSKLAVESSKQTDIITQLIDNAMECVGRGTKIVNEAADSLNRISDNTDMVDDIIVRLNEQSKLEHELMKEINTLSASILDVVTDNYAISKECASSSEELIDYSHHLKESVAKFITN